MVWKLWVRFLLVMGMVALCGCASKNSERTLETILNPAVSKLHQPDFDIKHLESVLQDGDLIFRVTSNPGSLVTAHAGGSFFAHAGIVQIEKVTGAATIYDAMPDRPKTVDSSSLTDFFSGITLVGKSVYPKLQVFTLWADKHDHFTTVDMVIGYSILRLKGLSEAERQTIRENLATFAHGYTMTYNKNMEQNSVNHVTKTRKVYCSELVYEVYKPILEARGVNFPFTSIGEVAKNANESAAFLRKNTEVVDKMMPEDPTKGFLDKARDAVTPQAVMREYRITHAIHTYIDPLLTRADTDPKSTIITPRDFIKINAFELVHDMEDGKDNGGVSLNPKYADISLLNPKYADTPCCSNYTKSDFKISLGQAFRQYVLDVSNGIPNTGLSLEVLQSIFDKTTLTITEQ